MEGVALLSGAPVVAAMDRQVATRMLLVVVVVLGHHLVWSICLALGATPALVPDFCLVNQQRASS
jgi:predicted secreted protein